MIVVGHATGAHVETIGDVPFTVTNVAIDLPVWTRHGKAPNAIKVRQTGRAGQPEVTAETVSKLLKTGSTYLLYVTPFELVHGVPTAQYVITGDERLWQRRSSGDFAIGVDATRLPGTVKVVGGAPNASKVVPVAR